MKMSDEMTCQYWLWIRDIMIDINNVVIGKWWARWVINIVWLLEWEMSAAIGR